jgi:hypothetical protein
MVKQPVQLVDALRAGATPFGLLGAAAMFQVDHAILGPWFSGAIWLFLWGGGRLWAT